MKEREPWLPDGYSQIFRLYQYVFGPLGFWTIAPLRYTAKFAIWQPGRERKEISQTPFPPLTKSPPQWAMDAAAAAA